MEGEIRRIGKDMKYGLDNEAMGMSLFELYLAVKDLAKFKDDLRNK